MTKRWKIEDNGKNEEDEKRKKIFKKEGKKAL